MQVLLTNVGGRRFALDCAEVVEVLPTVAHRPAGAGPPWLLGLFNLRGAMIPLVDLSVIVDGTQTIPKLGSRIVVLHHGELIAQGEPQAIIKDPRVIQAYLGRRYADTGGEAPHG